MLFSARSDTNVKILLRCVLFRQPFRSDGSGTAQYRTVVTRFPAACVLVESDGPRDDRVIMSVADSVQLDFLVVSCECIPEMTPDVGH
jgi:hypothetical protein